MPCLLKYIKKSEVKCLTSLELYSLLELSTGFAIAALTIERLQTTANLF